MLTSAGRSIDGCIVGTGAVDVSAVAGGGGSTYASGVVGRAGPTVGAAPPVVPPSRGVSSTVTGSDSTAGAVAASSVVPTVS